MAIFLRIKALANARKRETGNQAESGKCIRMLAVGALIGVCLTP